MPTPCTARAAIRKGKLIDRPLSIEPSMNRLSPIT